MRCRVCNTALTDEEATTKIPGTDEFVDECLSCSSNLSADLDELIEESYEDYG